MSPTATPRSAHRRGVVLAGAALVVSAAIAPEAQAVTKTFDYTCSYPYIAEQPLRVTLNAAIPGSYPVETETEPPFELSAQASGPGGPGTFMEAIGAASVEGSARTSFRLRKPSGQNLSFQTRLTLPLQSTTLDQNGSFTVSMFGAMPSLQFVEVGRSTFLVGDLALSLVPYRSDGRRIFPPYRLPEPPDPSVFDLLCMQSPVAGYTELGGIDVRIEGDPTPMPTPVVTPTPIITPTPTPTPTPVVTPTPTPVVTPTPTPVVTPTPVATPTPTPTPVVTSTPIITTTPTPKPGDTSLVKYPFDLKGTATLKTLTKGTLPLSGKIDTTLVLPSQTFTGALVLNPTSGKLTTLGFLPVDAKVNLVSTEPVTGSLKGGVLLANAKVRIKLPSVKTLGIELAGGANCQAKQISSIKLRSTQSEFLPTEGGPIAGTFSISDLTGCGFLNNLVSPLTAGGGNAIALNLINP